MSEESLLALSAEIDLKDNKLTLTSNEKNMSNYTYQPDFYLFKINFKEQKE